MFLRERVRAVRGKGMDRRIRSFVMARIGKEREARLRLACSCRGRKRRCMVASRKRVTACIVITGVSLVQFALEVKVA